MKKLFFNLAIVCSFSLIATSCSHRDDDIMEPNIKQEKIIKDNDFLSKVAGSIYFPTCSSPATENIQTWTNDIISLNLATESNHDRKYIWRQPTSVGGYPRFFKVQIKNKSTVNYPITVRLVGQDVIFGTADDYWFVIDDNGTCKDLLTNNSSRLFNNPNLIVPGTTSRVDYVQFEILIPNRIAAGKSASSVPVELMLSSYKTSPWF